MSTPTKADEILILAKAIQALGPNSYCGPWLESVLHEVQAEIQSDIMPSPSIVVTQRECNRLLEAANTQAREFLERTRKEADDIRRQAFEANQRMRNTLIDQVNQAFRLLTS